MLPRVRPPGERFDHHGRGGAWVREVHSLSFSHPQLLPQAEHTQEAQHLAAAIVSGALFVDPSSTAAVDSFGALSHGSCIKDAFTERCV